MKIVPQGVETYQPSCMQVCDSLATPPARFPLLPPSPPPVERVVTDLAAVRRITTEALQDMSQDNVRYAELRTTPRPLPDGTTRETYIKTVLQQLRIFEKENSRATEEDSDEASTVKRALLIPRLLLSVDRSRGVDEAMKVVELALSLKEHDEWGDYILGMDFSGNPTKGLFQDFR